MIVYYYGLCPAIEIFQVWKRDFMYAAPLPGTAFIGRRQSTSATFIRRFRTFLQSVQNAAARLVTGTRQCDHISPVLCQLHWLPVRQRVVFKIATLVHRSLSGNAPGYLADDCPLVADARVRQLRSADTRTLVVSQAHSSFGDRTFATTGPQVWNSLPPNRRLKYGQFRRLLKTYLFGQ